jgi:hypothetical protein
MSKKPAYFFRRALLGVWSVLCLFILKMSEPSSKVVLRVGKESPAWLGGGDPIRETFWYIAKVEIPTTRLRVYEHNSSKWVSVFENSLIPFYRELSGEDDQKKGTHQPSKENQFTSAQELSRARKLLSVARSGGKFEIPVFMTDPRTARVLDGRNRSSLMALFGQKVVTCLVVVWYWREK